MNDEPISLSLTVLSQVSEFIPKIAGWLNEEWPAKFDEDDAVRYLRTRAQDGENLPLALVVLAADEPVGTVSIHEEAIENAGEIGPWIARLYVIPEQREQGIGSLLVTTATRVAWQLGHERVYAATDQHELMDALGWKTRRKTERDGEPITIFEFEKPPAPPSYYDRVGGESKVRALVDRFYDLMDEKDEAIEVRAMHATSLKASRQKLFEFLSGWMGGPNLYIEKRGHPKLRMRHMPFSIGTEARDQWLMCMDQALDDVIDDEAVREELRDSFVRIADHMRNRRGP